MAFRKKFSRGKSRRDFSRKSGVHPKNMMFAAPMRGGIRL